jgi:hypothetical protein
MSLKTQPRKTCLNCGRQIRATVAFTGYCSNSQECRRLARRVREGKREWRLCEVCGKDTYSKLSICARTPRCRREYYRRWEREHGK